MICTENKIKTFTILYSKNKMHTAYNGQNQQNEAEKQIKPKQMENLKVACVLWIMKTKKNKNIYKYLH